MNRTVSRFVLAILASGIIILSTGCASYTIFGTPDEKDVITPGTIAVVSGSPEEADIRLAELFTDRLARDTGFKVLSQDEIFDRIPGYPAYSFRRSITGEGKCNSAWIPPDSAAKMSAYHSALGTRYILLVWTENLQMHQSHYDTSFGINFFSRLIEYPSGRVVGYSAYHKERGGCATVFHGTNRNIDKMLASVAEEVIEGLIEKTVPAK